MQCEKSKGEEINEKKCRRPGTAKKNWRWRTKVETEFLDRGICFKIKVIKAV